MKLPALQDGDALREVGAASIALIGAGPTSIYTLQALLARAAGPLSITIFEEQARAGLGTPYRPGWNDPAMLANIASIELPPVGMTLVEWLARQAPSGSRDTTSIRMASTNAPSTPASCSAITCATGSRRWSPRGVRPVM
jgi:hypothetical protein